MSPTTPGLLPLQDRDRELLCDRRFWLRPVRDGECAAAGVPDEFAATLAVRTAPGEGFVIVGFGEELQTSPELDALMSALNMRPGENSHLDFILQRARPEHLSAAADRLRKSTISQEA